MKGKSRRSETDGKPPAGRRAHHRAPPRGLARRTACWNSGVNERDGNGSRYDPASRLASLGHTVEDVMGAALFLASDASALVTGTSIVVDGGWTAD